MDKKSNIKLTAISNIDGKLIDESTQKRISLLAKRRKKPQKKLAVIIALAATLAILMTAMLAILIPMFSEKQIPIYTGMTVSEEAPITDVAKNPDEYVAVMKNGDNISVMPVSRELLALYGSRHGELDHANPFPNGKNDIVDKVSGGLSVAGIGEEIYYAKAGEDIYITVHLSNPDDFEILSFTLNGKKYASYMFEDGSDLENLILKYNVGDATGVVEYTLDEVKYVDGVEIKDVLMRGDKTVKVGVYTEDQPKVRVNNMNVGLTSVTFDVTLTDTVGLIAMSGGKVQAVIYDGETVIDTKDINVVGTTAVSFGGLDINTLYQVSVIAKYDALDGKGITSYALYQEAFYTEIAMEIDHTETTQTGVSFSYLWNNGVENKLVESVALYRGDEKVKDIDVSVTSVDGLSSNTQYTLLVTYLFNGKTETVELNFTTKAKTAPEYRVSSSEITKSSLGFNISKTDIDNIGRITKIELLHGNDTPLTVAVGETAKFENLLSNNEYTARVTFSYDLNDGVGEQTKTVETKVKTLAKTVPTYTIVDVTKTQTEISFGITETDADGIGEITKIELLYGNDTPLTVAVGETVKFENLLSNNEYTARVTYSYDLNDGVGEQTKTVETKIRTLAKAAPVISIDGISITDDKATLNISATDVDNTAEGITVALLHAGNEISQKTYSSQCEFTDLAYGWSYTLSVEVSYDLNDGKGTQNTIGALSIISIPIYVDEQGIAYETDANGNVVVKSFSGGEKNIIIPSNIGIRNVTAIADDVFKDTDIESVVIPSTVTVIGERAFYSCQYLQRIELNEGLTTIENSAFRFCSEIRNLVVPASVTTIEKYGISGIEYSNIYAKAISKPDGWASDYINEDQNVFWGFTRFVENGDILYALNSQNKAEVVSYLKTVERQSKIELYILSEIEGCDVIGVGSYACRGLFDKGISASKFVFPEKLEYIDKYAFRDIGIPEIVFPSTLKKIGKGAFADVSTYSVEFIGAFDGCIEESAFGGARFSSLIIPLDSTGEIKAGAFALDRANNILKFVNLPSNMKIDTDAFGYSYDRLDVRLVVIDGKNSDNYWLMEWRDDKRVVWNSYVDNYGVVYTLNEKVTDNQGNATMTVTDYIDANSSPYVQETVLGRKVSAIADNVFGDHSAFVPASIQNIGTGNDFVYREGVTGYRGYTGIYNGFVLKAENDSISILDHFEWYGFDYELIANYYDEETGLRYRTYCKPTGYTEKRTDLTVPDTLYGVPVTKVSIESHDLKTVTIPASVKSFYCEGVEEIYYLGTLDDYLLSGNTQTNVYIGGKKLCFTEYEGATYYGTEDNLYYALYKCSPSFNGTIHSDTEMIGKRAFSGSKANVITVPESVTLIADEAFDSQYIVEVYNLSSVDVSLKKYWWSNYYPLNIYTPTSGEKKTSVTDDGYILCDMGDRMLLVRYVGSEKNVSLPETFNGKPYDIYQNAFWATDIESIVIPVGVEEIGEDAFGYCSQLKSVQLPDGLLSIGGGAFRQCALLGEIIIPDTVTYIGVRAFWECPKLSKVDMGAGVQTIESYAFNACTSLETVTITASVNHIGNGAFEGCTALMQAIFEEPSEWLTVNYVLIDEAALSNRFSAAAALKTTYADETWERR